MLLAKTKNDPRVLPQEKRHLSLVSRFSSEVSTKMWRGPGILNTLSTTSPLQGVIAIQSSGDSVWREKDCSVIRLKHRNFGKIHKMASVFRTWMGPLSPCWVRCRNECRKFGLFLIQTDKLCEAWIRITWDHIHFILYKDWSTRSKQATLEKRPWSLSGSDCEWARAWVTLTEIMVDGSLKRHSQT